MREKRRLGVSAAAALSLVYAAFCLLLGLFMLVSFMAGRPLTSPAQILDPALSLFQVGSRYSLSTDGSELVVTPGLVRMVAVVNLLLLAGGAVLWGLAGTGLLLMRRWGGLLALGLLGATVFTGLLNILLGSLAGIALGGWASLEGLLPVVVGVALCGVVLPAAAAVGLLRHWAVFSALRSRRPGRFPPLMVGLAGHFFLAGGLLLGMLLIPDHTLHQSLLLGSVVLVGGAARLVSAALALAHLAAGLGFSRRRRWAYHLGLWMNLSLAVLFGASALLASDRAVRTVTAGVLPVSLGRGLCWLMVPLWLSLVATVYLSRRHFRRPSA